MRCDRDFYSFMHDRVSLHDCRITKIICEPDSIVFDFQEGFTLIDGLSSTSVSNGQVRLHCCTIHDINCKLIKRKANKDGSKFSGRSISIDAINKLLMKDYSIEIFFELYDDSFLYWRCTLYPPKRGCKGLFSHIVIEVDGFDCITICCDDVKDQKVMKEVT